MSDQTIHTTVSQPGRVGTHVESERTLVESISPPQQITRDDPNIVTKVVLSGRPGETGPQGDQGPQGDVGPSGPPGAPGGTYTHYQAVPASVWVIDHNLGFVPGGIRVQDSAGTDVEGDTSSPSINTVVLTFSAAFGGTAYLS